MEGPYMVVDIPHTNTFVLEDEDEKKLRNTFNVEHLKTSLHDTLVSDAIKRGTTCN